MNLGAPEIAIILVLFVLLFGARKLPELGSSVGKTITNFKQGLSEAKAEEEAEQAATPPPVPPSAPVAATDPESADKA
jgi:sec-independent protein translocase protein TatA